eukprot:862164-Amphidinium_carterae.2
MEVLKRSKKRQRVAWAMAAQLRRSGSQRELLELHMEHSEEESAFGSIRQWADTIVTHHCILPFNYYVVIPQIHKPTGPMC